MIKEVDFFFVCPSQKNRDIKKALVRGIEPKGGSFACKHLSMVKIRCTKDDSRVHMLAQLFRSNGLPLEKIYVRRSGSFCECLVSIRFGLCTIVVFTLLSYDTHHCSFCCNRISFSGFSCFVILS